MTRSQPRVLIAGYYGFSNTGDEAILAGMLRDLRTVMPDIDATVVSGNPVETADLHRVRAILFTDIDALTREAESADLLIVGGGGIFHDYWGFDPATLLTPQHGGLSFFCALPVLAARFEKPLMIYAVGVGPLKTEAARTLTRAAFQQAVVASVRDEASREELVRAGVDARRIEVTADPAFSYRPERPAHRTAAPVRKRPRLGVIARNWDIGVRTEEWEGQLANALDTFLERHGGEIVLLPFQNLPWDLLDDVAVARRIRDRMKKGAEVSLLEQPPGLAEAFSVIGSCDAVLPMRLHALIFGIQQMVAPCAVLYDRKVSSLADRVSLRPYSLELGDLQSQTISNRIDEVLAMRSSIRGHIEQALPQLRQLSMKNAELAASALQSKKKVKSNPEMVALLDQTKPRSMAKSRGGSTPGPFDIFAFPIINWDFRFQRPQQLLSRLARAGHRVFYLHTEFRGLDQPPLVTRLADGIFEVRLPGRLATEVYAGHLDGETLFQSVSALDSIVREQRITRAVSFVEYPFWAPLAGALRSRYGIEIVYDRLDDHTGFGTHGPQTIAEEWNLLRGADLIVASSARLAEFEGSADRPVVLLPNAVDFRHFNVLPDRATSPIANLPRPVVGYYGAIAHWFDTESVRHAAERLREWSFVLIGRHDDAQLRSLETLPNVHILGEKSYEELPAYLAAFDVCTIPFRKMPLTEAASPVKLFEYLAAGKPVVATDLPDVQEIKDLVYTYTTPSEFAAQLERAHGERSPELVERRKKYARRNTWDDRVAVLRPLLEDLARDTPPPVTAQTATSPDGRSETDAQRRELRALLKRSKGTAPIVFLPVEDEGRREAIAEALAERGRLVLLWEREDAGSPSGIVELKNNLHRARIAASALAQFEKAVVVGTLDSRDMLAHAREPLLVYDCVAAPGHFAGDLEELNAAHGEMMERASIVTFARPELQAELQGAHHALLVEDGASADELLRWIDRSERAGEEEQLRARAARLESANAALRSRIADRAAELRLLHERSAEHEKGIEFLRQEVSRRDRMIASGNETAAALQSALTSRDEAVDFLRSEMQEWKRIAAEREKTSGSLKIVEAELDIKRREAARLEAASKQQAEGIEWLRGEVATREQKLQSIYGSRMWKTADIYWRARRKVSRAVAPFRFSPRNLMLKVGRRVLPRPAKRFLKRFWDPNQQVSVAEATLLRERIPVQAPQPGLAAAPQPSTYDVICFSIIDWQFRWQRPQQIMSQFARNGHRVFFIKTTEFLPASRHFEIKPLRDNVWEITLAPSRAIDVYGGELTKDQIESVIANLNQLRAEFNINAAASVVQVPTWARAAYEARDRFGWTIVYDCMDEWNTFPGMKKELLAEEETLVPSADVVAVSAQRLLNKWAGRNPNLLLARNAADYDHYANVQPNDLLADLPHPIIGYFGAIAEWFDLPLMERLAAERPRYNFVLIGGIFNRDLDKLRKMPNVRILGQKPYDLMPSYLFHFDVCIIPFVVNAVTEATDPVKFYEYISLGKPVVAPRMPELYPYRDVLYIADDHGDFLRKVDLAVQENDPSLRERRVALARENTWAARVENIDEAIRAVQPRVSIIVVTYYNLDYTKLCVDSVFRNSVYSNFELIVVDNASTDGTPEYLKALQADHPNVKVILNSRNLGFAGANNQGLAAADGDYLILLNNDTVVPNGWLPRLIHHLRDKEIGLLVPVTNFSGNESRIDVPYTDLNQMEDFAFRYTYAHEGQMFDIRVAAMYCVAMRRDVFEKVGPLDDQFSVGMFEDDDYSHRMRLAGYRVVCVEDTFIHHFGQASFKKLTSGEYQAIWERNQELYEKKWGVQWKPHTLRPGVT